MSRPHDEPGVHVLAVTDGLEPGDLEALLAALAALGGSHVALDVAAEAPAGLKVSARTRFLGALPRGALLERLQRADVLLWLPSEDARLASAVPVAMAAGVCVVVSAVPATEGLVHDGEDGLRVEPGDGPDLLRALASVLGDGVERRRLGEAAAGAIRGALRSA